MIEDLYEVNRGSDYFWNVNDDFAKPSVNPLHDIIRRAEHKFHYRPEEAAMYHPQTGQGTKYRNNGAVDSFSKFENGTRSDPESQVQNEFANHKRTHIHSAIEWLTGPSESYVRGHRVMKTYGDMYTYGDRDIYSQSKGNTNVFVGQDNHVYIKGDAYVEVDGNATTWVKGDMQAQVDGDIRLFGQQNLDVRVNGNMSMIAGGIVTIDGALIYIG